MKLEDEVSQWAVSQMGFELRLSNTGWSTILTSSLWFSVSLSVSEGFGLGDPSQLDTRKPLEPL